MNPVRGLILLFVVSYLIHATLLVNSADSELRNTQKQVGSLLATQLASSSAALMMNKDSVGLGLLANRFGETPTILSLRLLNTQNDVIASGGSALVSLTTDLVMGLSGRLLLRTPAQFNPAAFASWEQYAVSGVVGLGTSVEINLNVVTTPGPYRRSTLIANGTLLQSVDVLGAAVSAVPEPTTWALMLAGLAGLKGLVRRSQRTRGRQDAGIPTPDDPARCRANAGKHRADNG